MEDVCDISRLSSLSVREIELLLGEAALSTMAAAKIATDAEKVGLGKEYFCRLLPSIRKQICKSKAIAKLFAKKQKDRNDLFITLGGALSGISPIPYLLAARVIHYGYAQLCPRQNAKTE